MTEKKMPIFRPKNEKMTHLNIFHAKILAYVKKNVVSLWRISIDMGQLAFLKAFILVAIPIDINDNCRHVHVFRKGSRHLRSVAKIWIESGGVKCVEIA